ncbi:MAG: UDP-N-acetylmuramoyl-L-alanine--D-glutamate ligase [Clostridia bacterium]|nr:UDP-N-acetylmuramoyl-L-alanine--D-glutamate ligase [Clostridia bacterium]
MHPGLESFKQNVKTKKVAIVGPGAANTPLIHFLGKLGADLTVFDRSEKETWSQQIKEYEGYSIRYSLGKDCLHGLKGYDVIFRAPGIRPDLPELLKEQKNGAVFTSEAEIFMDLCQAEIVGITGSHGKTSTAIIISRLLEENGYQCLHGFNIGTPLLDKLEEINTDYKVILELDSLQLATMKKSPHIAVVTTVDANCKVAHDTTEDFLNTTKNIFRFQSQDDLLILNYDNEQTQGFFNTAPGKYVFFSRTGEPGEGAFLREGKLCYKENGITMEIMDKKELLLPGDHNIENCLAAIAATRAYIKDDTVKKTLLGLSRIDHRIELVRELNEVSYYNDSAGISPARTLTALNAFEKRVVLIAGGYDEGNVFDSLGEALVEKVKHLILIGQTSSLIEMSLLRRLTGKYRGIDIRITHCATLRQAVDCASLSAKKGDAVLFSPASESFDMFNSLEDRGNRFREYVLAL